jgi:hypothetical protein
VAQGTGGQVVGRSAVAGSYHDIFGRAVGHGAGGRVVGFVAIFQRCKRIIVVCQLLMD